MSTEKQIQITVAMTDLIITKYYKEFFVFSVVFALVVIIWVLIAAFKE